MTTIPTRHLDYMCSVPEFRTFMERIQYQFTVETTISLVSNTRTYKFIKQGSGGAFFPAEDRFYITCDLYDLKED